MYSLIKRVFKGTPSKEFFAFLKSNVGVLNRYDIIEVPCVGTFSIPLFLVRQLGIAPEKLICSDISDYSKQLFGLVETGIGQDLRIYLLDQMRMKFGESNIHGYDELVHNTVATWKDLYACLKGRVYKTKDVLAYVNEREQGRLLLINPPNIKNGYKKMFPTDTMGGIEHFSPKSITEIFKCQNDAIIHTSQTPEDTYAFTSQAAIVKNKHIIHIWSNVPTTTAVYQTARPANPWYKLATLDDLYHPESIGVAPLKAHDALCLRDLFIHKLGQTKAEKYIALTLNNKIFAVVGLHLSDFNTEKTTYLQEQFGMTVQMENEKTAKLMLMLLLSREVLLHIPNKIFLYRKPVGIMTSCLSKYPEVKTDRGVLKMYKREKLKDGTFKIGYQSEFKYETFREAWEDWLKKYGNRLQAVRADRYSQSPA